MQNLTLFAIKVDTTESDQLMAELCKKTGIETNHPAFFKGCSLSPDVDVIGLSQKPRNLKSLADNISKQARSRYN